MQPALASPDPLGQAELQPAAVGACYSVVAADRSATDRVVRALMGHDSIEASPRDGAGTVRFTLALGAHDRPACVHRTPRLLSDHTLLENWMMCLWGRGDTTGPAARREIADAMAFYSAVADLPPQAYPAALPELSLVAAQFVQAHLVRARALVLDAVLAGWHPTQRAVVARFIAVYRRRFPFHPIVHVDRDMAGPPFFPSQVLDAL